MSARRRGFGTALVYILLGLGLVFVLVPIWYMAATSFKQQSAVFELPPKLWPDPFTIQNYADILTTNHFERYFLNSAIVATVTVFGTLVISAMLAYAFARLHFPGRDVLFSVLLLGMMIPPVMLIIPQFLVAADLKLLNTHAGLILVYITMNLAMQTFLLRGVFENIPHDLEEAAIMDGASHWVIFWRVIIPLSTAGIAVVVINSFLFSWEEFAWAQVSLREESLRTLPIAIANYQGEHLTQWGHVFAATMIALIPVIIIYLIFQRQFVQGIATTGIKG